MRALLKILLVVVAVIVLCAGGGLAYLFTQYPDVPPPENVSVAATPERVARGAYLANHVAQCVDCHSVRDFTKYAGPVIEATQARGGASFGVPGTAVSALYSRNITPAAIGSWTDGELIRAVTAGVNKDGEALFPIMPYQHYGKLSKEDVEAIVAYVRTLKPLDYTPPPRQLRMPLPLIVRTMPTAAASRPIPPVSDQVAYGEYVINAAVCSGCHTPMDDQGGALPGMDYAGGFEFQLPGGGVVRSSNITPDATTGIGSWTEQQFIDKFKAFEHAPARSLTAAEQRENTMMPWIAYAGMTREDLAAVYAYLRSIKPIVNRVQKHN